MTVTFTPPINPAYSSPFQATFATSQVNFGDGYNQRTAAGIKTRQRLWNLSWQSITEAQNDALTAFFDSCGEYISFTWADPLGINTKWFTKGGYNSNPIAKDVFDLSVQLEEDLSA